MKLLGTCIAAAALAVSATGVVEASIATIANTSANGSELVFNLVNKTAQNSLLVDLGTTIDQFLANPNQSFEFNFSDANFQSFASAYSAGDNVTWGVSGGRSQATSVGLLSTFGFYTTSVVAAPTAFDANLADINNTFGKWNQILVAPNNTADDVAVNNSSFQTVGQTGYTGPVGDDFQTALPFVAQGALGSSLFFVREFITGANVGQLGTYANVWNFVINGDAGTGFTGTLTFAPVPLPAAVWLFGAGLMALLRLNRRQSLAA